LERLLIKERLTACAGHRNRRKPFYLFTIEEILEPKGLSYIKPPVDPADGMRDEFWSLERMKFCPAIHHHQGSQESGRCAEVALYTSANHWVRLKRPSHAAIVRPF
jgi:hypothetical protein